MHCLSIWWRTPQIGRFWIEPPPRDPIKGTLANGLVWEPHVVRPVILIEILGGKAYPGAPTRGFHPPAMPQDLERIHATWRRIEAFGYRVRPVLDYDYIALPRSDG